MSEWWGWMLTMFVGFFVLYLAARFIFTAYFQSKADFEKLKERQNGKK